MAVADVLGTRKSTGARKWITELFEAWLLSTKWKWYPHKRRHSRWKLSQELKRQIGYILCKVHVWKWPVVKNKHIKIKPRICILFILCLTWTMNANSLKQNIIVIKEICSWLPHFCKHNLLLFIQPRWQLNRYISATVWPILIRFGTVTHIGLLQRTDR